MKKCVLWITALMLLLVFVFPYVKVEILTIYAEKKLDSFDLSYFDNVYCEGTPKIYDCKIYEYRREKYAKALYVLGDCEFGVMVELQWNHDSSCWEFLRGQNVWTVHGGSAQEFYWPLYYAKELFFG